jgi:proline iminopeptidase
MMARYEAFQKEMENPALSAEEKTARQKALWLEEFFLLSTADPEAARPLLEATFGGAEFSFAHADYTQREQPAFDNRDKLPGISVPALVMAGEHDMMPVEKAWEMDGALPDSTLLLFEKSGHFAPIEEPEAFRNAIWQFLGVME